MSMFSRYLDDLDQSLSDDKNQSQWRAELDQKVSLGRSLIDGADEGRLALRRAVMRNWTRTEELKAWYGAPDGSELFQGTSVTSITIPAELPNPLDLNSIEDLEDAIAEHFITLHDKHKKAVDQAILENTDKWLSEGLFFGIALGSKMLSQAFGLTVDADSVVFDIDGVTVDPHEITSYSPEVRKAYFKQATQAIDCFDGVENLSQTEFETSLVLADISKPRIDRYKNSLMLAPIRCNELAANLSRRVTKLIAEKTEGRIAPRSLMVTIYDTDTPYTYDQISGYFGRMDAPSLPGLTVLGTSGSIDAFRWLYAYRCSLVAQKIMKSSLYSETERRFIPFVFFGVLVERDAEILLDLDRLSLLRYRGNLSPLIEYAYLVPKIEAFLNATKNLRFEEDWKGRLA